MDDQKMNPIARAQLMTVAVFAICLVIGYVRNVFIGGGAFESNWVEYVAIAIVAGIATYFRAQRSATPA